MLHLFGRIYLEHEVFYNTKYDSVVLSTNEKPHPISEKIGEDFGRVQAFDELIKVNYQRDINLFWKKLFEEREKKTIIYSNIELKNCLTIQYWKSIFENPSVDFVYQLYLTQHTDEEVKLLLNINRADNFKRLRPGDIAKLSLDEFEKIYNETQVVDYLKNCNKEDFSFELLLPSYFTNPESYLSLHFFHRLKKLCWRTWFSDLDSLRNDYLGSFFFTLNQESFEWPEVREVVLNLEMTKSFLDPNFNPDNSHYILKNYKPDNFKDLYNAVTPFSDRITTDNPWDNFCKFTDVIFEENYLLLLEKDIQNQKGCTFIRDHLVNESNQILASYIYENIRLNNKAKLERFRLN